MGSNQKHESPLRSHGVDMNSSRQIKDVNIDLEKNTGSNNSSKTVTEQRVEAPTTTPYTSNIQIPTKMDVFYDFNGSLGFAVGSSGFILAMYFENWLPYFRYGSLIWIWGCVMYSIPLFQKFKGYGGCSSTNKSLGIDRNPSKDEKSHRCMSAFPWDLGDLGEFLCYLFYTIGCILGGFFDEVKVEQFLPAINHTFVYGSFSLVLKPVYQLVLFLLARGGCRASRSRASELSGSSSVPGSPATSASSIVNTKIDGHSNNNSHVNAPTSPALLKIQLWDRIFELSAILFFCAAGLFGGFPPHPSLALPGVYFWEVGSLFSVGRSIVMVCKRNHMN